MSTYGSNAIDLMLDHLTIRATALEIVNVWDLRIKAHALHAARAPLIAYPREVKFRAKAEALYLEFAAALVPLVTIGNRDYPPAIVHNRVKDPRPNARPYYTRRDPLDGLAYCTCAAFRAKGYCFHSRKHNIWTGMADDRDIVTIGPWAGQLRHVHEVKIRDRALEPPYHPVTVYPRKDLKATGLDGSGLLQLNEVRPPFRTF